MTRRTLTLSEIVQHFLPSWFAVVMGTAVIVIAIFVFRKFVPFAYELQVFFLATAGLLFVILSVPWTMRWLQYPAAARRDLANPTSGAFFPTMPISLLVIGIAIEKTGLPFLSEDARWGVLQVLWILGSAGILFFALTILHSFFHQSEIKWEASTLGWLIPPVSALLIPVLGTSLTAHFAGTPWGTVNMIGSLVFLGAGGILFILVMAVVFARYIFYTLPPLNLAPTLWIGIAPTSILAIVALKLVKPLQAILAFSPQTEETLSVLAQVSATALWGFALFWLALALVVTLALHRKTPLPFALSWWAFVFPMGAFTVATGVLYQALPYDFFRWVGLAALVAVLILWLTTMWHTWQGVQRGSLFQPHDANPGAAPAH